MQLDRIDIKILATLQKNGRITNHQLSMIAALSPSACLERVRKLEKCGIIESYQAVVDIAQLQHNQLIYAEITLQDHRYEDFQRFETGVQNIPEIIECYAVGGGIDYIARFQVRNISHYQIIMDRLLEESIGIEKYFSYIITKPVKRFAGFVLEE